MTIRTSVLTLTCSFAAFTGTVWAQLPEGPGRDATMEVCGKCHDVSVVTAYHQSKEVWTDTISQMIDKGAEGTDAQFAAVLAYLVKNFGPAVAGTVNVNKVTANELQTKLDLSTNEAEAIVKYRGENGDFKELADLKKVPNLDFKKIEAKKDRITFRD